MIGAMPAHAGLGETIKNGAPIVCKAIGDNAAKIGAGAAALAAGAWVYNLWTEARRFHELKNQRNKTGQEEEEMETCAWGSSDILLSNKVAFTKWFVGDAAYTGAAAYTLARFCGENGMAALQFLHSGVRSALQGAGNHAGKIGLGFGALASLALLISYKNNFKEKKEEEKNLLAQRELSADQKQQLEQVRNYFSKEGPEQVYPIIAGLSSAAGFASWVVAKSLGWIGSKI